MTSLFARDFSIRSIAILRDHLLHSNFERSYMTLRLLEIAIYNFSLATYVMIKFSLAMYVMIKLYTHKTCDRKNLRMHYMC